MTLTKDKIVEIIKEKTSFSTYETKNLVELLLELIKARLENGEEVKISGFGKWIVREKKSRPGRNPHTGERIQIVARRVVTFHPAEKLKDIVNNADMDDSKISRFSKMSDDDDE